MKHETASKSRSRYSGALYLARKIVMLVTYLERFLLGTKAWKFAAVCLHEASTTPCPRMQCYHISSPYGELF